MPIFRVIAKLFLKPLGLVCPLHDCPFQTGSSSAQVGLARNTPEYAEAQKKFFPLVQFSRLGATDVKFLNARVFQTNYPRVFFCPDCRRAEQIWLEANPINWLSVLRPIQNKYFQETWDDAHEGIDDGTR